MEKHDEEQINKIKIERVRGGGADRQRQTDREREKELENLFSKDCSLGSFRPV